TSGTPTFDSSRRAASITCAPPLEPARWTTPTSGAARPRSVNASPFGRYPISSTIAWTRRAADEGVNAVNIRQLVEPTAPGVSTTTETHAPSIIQSRHRIPERPLRSDQILVLQVPGSEPLGSVERREAETRRMHAEADYSQMWVAPYGD